MPTYLLIDASRYAQVELKCMLNYLFKTNFLKIRLP